MYLPSEFIIIALCLLLKKLGKIKKKINNTEVK